MTLVFEHEVPLSIFFMIALSTPMNRGRRTKNGGCKAPSAVRVVAKFLAKACIAAYCIPESSTRTARTAKVSSVLKGIHRFMIGGAL